jgi:hypothetical protein
MIWFLLFAPPCLAFAWHVVWKDFLSGKTPPWQCVRPGKYGKYDFWVTLGVLYVAMFATALVLHKL